MPVNIDFVDIEKRVMTQLVYDTKEAMENSLSNGFPTHQMSDRELAEDLWDKAGFVGDHSVLVLEHAVKMARELRQYKVYRNYGWNSQELLLETWDEEYARRWFSDAVDAGEEGYLELAYFAEDGEYCPLLSHGEAPD